MHSFMTQFGNPFFWEVGVAKKTNARNVIIINGVSAGNVINHIKRKRWDALFRWMCDALELCLFYVSLAEEK